MFLIWSCSCLCLIHWSQVLSIEWRCSWSRADKRCSNYIWVINNVIANQGATYIRSSRVCLLTHQLHDHFGYGIWGSYCLPSEWILIPCDISRNDVKYKYISMSLKLQPIKMCPLAGQHSAADNPVSEPWDRETAATCGIGHLND